MASESNIGGHVPADIAATVSSKCINQALQNSSRTGVKSTTHTLFSLELALNVTSDLDDDDDDEDIELGYAGEYPYG